MRSIAAALFLVAAAPALAIANSAPPKIAVLPFSGPQGSRAQLEAARALRRKGEIVSAAAWNAAAKKSFATSKSAADYAAVAAELGVKVIVTGAIKRDGGWVLVVSVRQGASGKSVEKLKYPLHGPRLDSATLRRLGNDIGPSVDNVIAGAAPVGDEGGDASEPAATPGADAQPERNIEDEDPLAQKTEKQKVEPAAPRIERPAWSPYFDVSVGLTLSSRSFGFDQAGLPQFGHALGTGLRFDLNAYPLAALATRAGAGVNAITGLGLGLTFDDVFWADSIPCARGMNGQCAPTTDHYSTSERRIEVGLRWHWNFLNAPMRPDLLVSIQYGSHDFIIQKKADGSDVGPPDVSYSYVTIGVGTRVPIIERLALFVTFNLHLLVDAGAIQSAAEFGPGGGYGIRLTLGGDIKIFKGLFARLSAFYEQFGLSFNQSTVPPPTKSTTGGATDQYYGGLLSVGYQF